MFWRAWNPSLNCSDFNSASLNTWLTNTAKQSITVGLSKKCNLFSVYGTCTCGTCFSFTVYLFQFIRCTFIFCFVLVLLALPTFTWHTFHLWFLENAGCLQTSCDCGWKEAWEKRSWKCPSWRKHCPFCPYLPEHQRPHIKLGAHRPKVFLWRALSAMAQAMGKLRARSRVLRGFAAAWLGAGGQAGFGLWLEPLSAATVTAIIIILVCCPFKRSVNLLLFQATSVGCQHCKNIQQKLMLRYAHHSGCYH